MQSILAGILRAVLALFAGTVGTSDQDISAALIGFIDGIIAGDPNKIGAAALTLGVIVWSIYDKRKEAKSKEAVQ